MKSLQLLMHNMRDELPYRSGHSAKLTKVVLKAAVQAVDTCHISRQQQANMCHKDMLKAHALKIACYLLVLGQKLQDKTTGFL